MARGESSDGGARGESRHGWVRARGCLSSGAVGAGSGFDARARVAARCSEPSLQERPWARPSASIPGRARGARLEGVPRSCVRSASGRRRRLICGHSAGLVDRASCAFEHRGHGRSHSVRCLWERACSRLRLRSIHTKERKAFAAMAAPTERGLLWERACSRLRCDRYTKKSDGIRGRGRSHGGVRRCAATSRATASAGGGSGAPSGCPGR